MMRQPNRCIFRKGSFDRPGRRKPLYYYFVWDFFRACVWAWQASVMAPGGPTCGVSVSSFHVSVTRPLNTYPVTHTPARTQHPYLHASQGALLMLLIDLSNVHALRSLWLNLT